MIFVVSCSYVAIKKTTILPTPQPSPVKTNVVQIPIQKTNAVTTTNKPITLLSIPRRPVEVSGATLLRCLRIWGISPSHVITGDANYMVIPIENLKYYYQGFKVFVSSNELVTYKAEKNDCDDIAKTFSFYCRSSIRTDTNFVSGFAVADIYFKGSTPDTAHAINMIFAYDENNVIIPVFIDAFKEPFIPGSTNFSTNQYKEIYFFNM